MPGDAKNEQGFKLTREQAGYRQHGEGVYLRHSQKRCRRCGGYNLENVYLRLGSHGEDNHYVECLDCGFSDLLGTEY